ncbi:protein phosphatase 1 regulatory subunit 37 [Schistocerca cancellata]|uniref:protein phosphatase 1 regulatory subunit 37 n=1 Tax=Schistocerca cancellata TaxID=274614 RepID=UPI00211749E5|nr:protein phosphatase 1 regulatory subunit 37 [Schistocerca cancellata]
MSDPSKEDQQEAAERITSRVRNSKSSRRYSFSVSFPAEENQLITGYLEPPNPWQYAENITRKDVVDAYKLSCCKHGVQPLPAVLKVLEEIDLDIGRNEILDLAGEQLVWGHCESLEEVLKRVQFKHINLEATSLDDEGSVALFDMVEYYEAAVHLNISSNPNIGVRGWQACSRMIKKTLCLEQLEARNLTLNEQFMPILSRALRIGTQLQVLKLENCGLAGRPTVILTSALKLNSALKELYLADNNLGPTDAIQIGALLRANETLQLLDISNNNIQDAGLCHIADGLAEQPSGAGLCILVIWNNHLTTNASKHLARLLSHSKTLETLNVGHNTLSSECLHIIKEPLQQNRSLLRLGMQSTHLSCEGVIALAECIADNNVIQRIDLRDNNIQLAGLLALTHSLKVNHSVTQVDLDDRPKKKMEDDDKQYEQLVAEVRRFCTRNQEQASEHQDTVGAEVPERRLRIPKSVSRKISLTCETLMRNVETANHQQPQPHHLLPETRPRGGGGRLRSPAPSPSPSPVSSPIPSPSRNRFQVSRVSEMSSPTTFFEVSSSPSSCPVTASPSASSSRFQVTSVEPSVLNPDINRRIGRTVTPGFSFKLNDNDVSPNNHLEMSDESKKSETPLKPSVGGLTDESAALRASELSGSSLSSSIITGDATQSSPGMPTQLIDTSKISQNIAKQMQSLSSCASLLSLASDTSEDNDDMEVRRLMDPESFTEKHNQLVTDIQSNSSLQSTNFEIPVPKVTTHSDGGVTVSSNPTNETHSNSSKLVSRFGHSTVPQPQRKISWVAPPDIHVSDQKATSNLEKLMGLFQQPGSFFNKSQPQYKATAAIINQQPTSNSDAAFLLTAGPLANAVKDAMLQKSGKLIPEGPEVRASQSPVPDFINNNKTGEAKVSECDDKKEISPVSYEKGNQPRIRHHEDENFNLAKPCLPVVTGEDDRDNDDDDDDCDTRMWCPVTSVCGSGIKLWDSADVDFSQSACGFQCGNLSVIDDARTVMKLHVNEVGSPAAGEKSDSDCHSPFSFEESCNLVKSPENVETTDPDLRQAQLVDKANNLSSARDDDEITVVPD